ncbi:16479_t:CDS:2, partial [Dentiscutata heterogama]
TREPPFDILFCTSKTLLIWWFSLEDSFPKVDEYLNSDEDDFVEITEVDLNESKENTNLSEETNLLLNNILNVNKFKNEFEDDDFSIDEDYYTENREKTSLTNQLQEDID